MDFQELENKDGVRCTWNCFPKDATILEELIIPLAVIYTPYKPLENVARLDYAPQKCKTCEAFLNPYCQIVQNKLWNCVFCQNKNQLPQGFVQYLNQGQFPPELQQSMTTVEYSFAEFAVTDNFFLFMIDVSLEMKELKAIKETLIKVVKELPDNISLSMITFSRYITVYEMANSKFIKSVMMDGKEKIAQDDILKMLGIGADKKEETAKYIVNVGQKRENIVEIIESLQPDPWLCLQHGRYERPTFVALQACLAIATAYKSNGGRIVSCLGGPATLGEGTVASMSKEQIIRAHCDLEEETEKAKVYKDACTAYKKITERLIQLNLTLDIFGFSTDQWGLGEMKSMVTSTGGLVFMHEEFNDQLFKDNFKNYFGLNDFSELKVASGGTLTMHVSPPLLIKGALGPLQAIPNKSKQAAKEKIGEGETNQWFLGGLDQNLSYTFILELISGKNVKPADNNAYVQFATKYKHPSGAIFQRVTTMVRSYLDQSTPIQFLGGVDQETVIAVYSKLAARKSFETDSIPVIRWLDRVLISTMKKFSNFRKGDKGSFQICEELYLLPQFFYYLRKSSLVRKFATSVDEAVYYRLCIDRECVANSLIMVQPSLTQYDLENSTPVAAICDIESMKDNVILMMDSYFHIVVWRGSTIVQWVKEGYHELPDYENLKAILTMLDEDIQLLIQDRMLIPKIVKCDQGHGDERIIKSKLNPSGQGGNTTAEGGYFITDDKSLHVFMDHLVAAVVAAD